MQKNLTDRLGRPVKHGMHNTPEYNAWKHMKDRCLNPNSQRWDRYGGRGISICARWLESFENFYEDVGSRPSREHSLERLDNNGNYEPGNVAWEVCEHQNNNKATSVKVTCDGETMTVNQWAKRVGINERTLGLRLKAGWSAEKAIKTPPQPRTWRRAPGRRLLNADRVREIRRRRSAGESLSSISRSMDVSIMLVSRVSKRALWGHVADEASSEAVA